MLMTTQIEECLPFHDETIVRILLITREVVEVLSLCFNGKFSRWTWASRYKNVSIVNFTDGGGGDN